MTTTLKKFLSSRGEIFADERSNQLIIRDIPSVIPTIDNLLHQLDRKSQQVEIEARVVSASRSFAQDIGTELVSPDPRRTVVACSSWAGWSSGVTTGGAVPTGPVVSLHKFERADGLPLAVSLAPAFQRAASASHIAPRTLPWTSSSPPRKRVRRQVALQAARCDAKQRKAVVKQGTKIPIQTTINNTISITFIDAVLKLK